jgi:hypothetical protein
MPAKSEKQRKFAGMSRTPEGRAKLRASGKKPMPVKTAKDFSHRSTRKK